MINFPDTIVIFFVFLLGFFLNLFLNRKSTTDKTQSLAIQDLERRLTDLMSGQLQEIRGTVDGSSKTMMDQVRSFTQETTGLKNELENIQKKVSSISSFQEIFRSPKLRGQWGEASLEYILSQHYPAELYETQYLFSSGHQVDVAIKLPNKKILPIDAKFSSENFERMIHAQEDEKEAYSQKFINDIKQRILEISSKYIRPAENTVDFALMYIPAEAIYYEIMFNLAKQDIAEHAWKKKVVLTSPNTIYLTLRTIEHWFQDTQFSKKTQEIIQRFERITKDADVLADEFRKLGRHIKESSSAYERSEKRLSLLGNRVKQLIKIGDKKKLKTKQETKKYVSSN